MLELTTFFSLSLSLQLLSVNQAVTLKRNLLNMQRVLSIVLKASFAVRCMPEIADLRVLKTLLCINVHSDLSGSLY